jgi:hypothetical protein
MLARSRDYTGRWDRAKELRGGPAAKRLRRSQERNNKKA